MVGRVRCDKGNCVVAGILQIDREAGDVASKEVGVGKPDIDLNCRRTASLTRQGAILIVSPKLIEQLDWEHSREQRRVVLEGPRETGQSTSQNCRAASVPGAS